MIGHILAVGEGHAEVEREHRLDIVVESDPEGLVVAELVHQFLADGRRNPRLTQTGVKSAYLTWHSLEDNEVENYNEPDKHCRVCEALEKKRAQRQSVLPLDCCRIGELIPVLRTTRPESRTCRSEIQLCPE